MGCPTRNARQIALVLGTLVSAEPQFTTVVAAGQVLVQICWVGFDTRYTGTTRIMAHRPRRIVGKGQIDVRWVREIGMKRDAP